MSQILIEAHWLRHYLEAAWTAGWEAHQRNPDMHNGVMLDETRKIAMMAAGLIPDEPKQRT